MIRSVRLCLLEYCLERNETRFNLLLEDVSDSQHRRGRHGSAKEVGTNEPEGSSKDDSGEYGLML